MGTAGFPCCSSCAWPGREPTLLHHQNLQNTIQKMLGRSRSCCVNRELQHYCSKKEATSCDAAGEKKKRGGGKGVICMVGIALVGPVQVVVAEGWSPRHRDSLHVSKSSLRNRNGATRMGWWQGFRGFWGILVQTNRILPFRRALSCRGVFLKPAAGLHF